MAWVRSKKPIVVHCNTKLALQFATMEPAPNDRALSNRRLDVVSTAMQRGDFRGCEWTSAYCKQTDKTYRINGKHTSKAFSELNGTAPRDMFVLVTEFHCDTLEDVAKLYATFDTKSSVRTSSDINMLYAASNPRIANISSTIINVCVTGMARHKWQSLKYGGKSAEVKAALLLEHPEFVEFVDRIVDSSKDSRHIRRGPVVAAMYATWLKNKNVASEFWQEVKDGSNSNHKNASRTLNRFLDKSAVSASGVGKDGVSARMMYVKCLHAWNAWRQNQSTDLKYHADKPAPALV